MADGKVTVFFTWQSDSPEVTNRKAIRASLRKASKKLGASGYKVIIDEATRDTSGSPNIALTILEKIHAADILIADITTVHVTGERKSPNPNVVFELGYGVSELGWDRIILLFNTEFGHFPNDMPFDFIQNRASPYQLKESHQADDLKGLDDLCYVALSAVIKKNPKRPAELRGLQPDKIKHERDLETMRWLMSSLHLPTLDQCIKDIPRTMSDSALWFYENVQGVVENSLFHLYDNTLADAVRGFFRAWSQAVSHAECYQPSPSGNSYTFWNPGDGPLTGDREAAWNEIASQRNIMRSELDKVLARLRENYLEIDLADTNKTAWLEFQSFEKEMLA